MLCASWDSNSGALEEQQLLLTTEASRQANNALMDRLWKTIAKTSRIIFILFVATGD